MADTWANITRALSQDDAIDDAQIRSSSANRNLFERLTGQDFTGFQLGDFFDKDRWSRRERENQGRRLEETGIPDYTNDYVPRDQYPIITALKSDNIGPGVSLMSRADREAAKNLYGGKPTGRARDLSALSRDSRFAPGRVPGNVNDTRAYLPGRMSVGEARRARAMRNMSRRDRAAAGFGDLGPTTRWGGQDTSGRIFPEMFRAGNQYGIHSDAMARHRANTARSGRIHDRVQMALNPEQYAMMGSSQGPDSWDLLVESLENAGFERTEDVGRGGDR